MGADAHTQPLELQTLGHHRAQCSADSGRWVAVRCGAMGVLGFVSARLVTTTAVLTLLAAVWLLWH